MVVIASPVGWDVAAPDAQADVDGQGVLAVAVGARNTDGVVVITVAGALDHVSGERLWEVLDSVFRGPVSRVVMDAAAVASLDSAGVDILESLDERAADWDFVFAVGGLVQRFPALLSRSGVRTLGYRDLEQAYQAVQQCFLPGDPNRLDLLREIGELRAAIPRPALT